MASKSAKQSAKKALEEVAKKHRVSVETVRREIKTAVAAARENTDPGTRAFWDSVPSEGEAPTPEEIVAYIAMMGRGVVH